MFLMNVHKILAMGFVVGVLYLVMVVYIEKKFTNTLGFTSKSSRFLYHLSSGSIDIVSKLSYHDRSTPLISTLDMVCKSYSCTKSVEYSKELESSNWSEFVRELIEFSIGSRLSEASIIVEGKDIDVKFLLSNVEQFDSLLNIYRDYNSSFSIEDSSSVVKFFSVKDLENEMLNILNGDALFVDSLEVDAKSKEVLDRALERIKELGSVKIALLSPLKVDQANSVKSYIKSNYSWIDDVSLQSSSRFEIKIEEVIK
jgi:hypothetical protein